MAMEYRDIPPVVGAEQLGEILTSNPDVRLLDVRTPGEFESVHIRGAYNVPLDRLAEHAAELRAAVAAPVILVCQSGQRARRAEAMLREIGMSNLHLLDGGVSGWLGAGLPVERGACRLTLERQVRLVAGAFAAAGAFLALVANPWFALVPLGVGGGLMVSGATGACGMALLLARIPYNRPASCDVDAVVRALRAGPAANGGAGPWTGDGNGATRVAAEAAVASSGPIVRSRSHEGTATNGTMTRGSGRCCR